MKNIFKCNQNDNEAIPMEIIYNTNFKFPNLHTNCKDIAYISKKLKEYRSDSICKLPFCTTVEAESMGANINLGDEKNCPRIKSYEYNNLEELKNIKEIDLHNGRIKEVLDSIDILNKQGEIVTLNVCGPFTIMSLLIDPKYFYKGIKKNRDLVNNVMKIIEDNIVRYIVEGFKKGAKIISYSDPVGDVDIVGPRVYKDVLAETTINIIKRIEHELDDIVIHLCGKTSTALYNLGFCELQEVKYDEKLTYGESICSLLDYKGVKIIGHNCMKKTPYKINNSLIYNINLASYDFNKE